jgi:hypothetical protein
MFTVLIARGSGARGRGIKMFIYILISSDGRYLFFVEIKTLEIFKKFSIRY